MSTFKRSVLKEAVSGQVVGHLQQRLIDLLDLALQLKQAHWNVVGANFRAVHLQLDEIVIDVRAATDEVAERISTLGTAPDGGVGTLAEQSKLEKYPKRFVSTTETVSLIADRLDGVIRDLRASMESLGSLDPVSEDMLIAITVRLEKHLWMVQAQEL